MLKMILFEYLQGRRSPAQWFKDAKEHDAMRYLGRGITPSRTTWYDFRDRLAPIIQSLHDELIGLAIGEGLLEAKTGVQDGTMVAACASRHRVVNRLTLAKRRERLARALESDQLGEPLEERMPLWVPKTSSGRADLAQRMARAKEFLDQRIAKNAEKPKDKRADPDRITVSISDPEAAMGRDKLKVFRPLYTLQFMVEPKSLLVLGYLCRPEATDAATLTPMIDQVQSVVGGTLEGVLADAAYATMADLIDCNARGIDLVAPVGANSFSDTKPNAKAKSNRDQFEWLVEKQTYRCPAGHELKHSGTEKKRRSGDRQVIEHRYHCGSDYCRDCPLASACVKNPGRGRTIKRLEGQELLDAQRQKMDGEAIRASYRERSQVIERAFADAKVHRRWDRFCGRGLRRAATETGLLVLAQNLLTLHRLQRDRVNSED